MGFFGSLFGKKDPEPAPPAKTPLAAALERWANAGRPSEQVTALEALAEVGGPEARKVLEAAVQDVASVHAQIAAARLLGETGDPAAAEVLKKVADPAFWKASSDARARSHTGMGLGSEAGRAAAQGNEKLVRQACENALKKLPTS
jgi:HEAT repeat protein